MNRSTRRSTARAAARQVGQVAPADAAALLARTEVAVVHHQAGRFAIAARIYREILATHPRYPPALHLLGLIALQTGDDQGAVDLIERAIGVNPDVADFHCNLAVVFRRMDRLDDALASADRASRLSPGAIKPQLEQARALASLRRPAEALAIFESVLAQDPANPWAQWGEATTALILGDFQRGWAGFECRWRYAEAEFNVPLPAQASPLWDGQRHPDATILLQAEQGLGDTIQFVRYAPLVKARVGRVLLECQAELRDLLDGAPGVDQVLARGARLPHVDLHAPLMSLPWLLGTRLATIPAVVPYLPVAARRVSQRSEPSLSDETRLKVGLVWAGDPSNTNDYRRSMSLATFAPLAGIVDVAFFALQKGPPGDQVPPSGLSMIDLGPNLSDFADTAAVLAQLDLVITVDTAVAHLAGALGRPVWLMLAFAPDFRWLLDRADSPWYPTLRLFRQPRRGDWAGVMHDVRDALTLLAAQHGP